MSDLKANRKTKYYPRHDSWDLCALDLGRYIPSLLQGKKINVSCAVRLQGDLVGTFLSRDPEALS